MTRIAIVFLVAVFVPSLFLGGLALRTAGEQQGILERQTAELYQNDADALAAELADTILGRQREFAEKVRTGLSGTTVGAFSESFQQSGVINGIPFVIAPGGSVLLPRIDNRLNRQFLSDNSSFLNNDQPEEIFPTAQNAFGNTVQSKMEAVKKPDGTRAVPDQAVQSRNVSPAIQTESEAESLSKVTPRISSFDAAIGSGADGVLARFNQDQLELLFWTRPPAADGFLFGEAIPAREVASWVRDIFPALAPGLEDACVAVLDENAAPVVSSAPGFRADWRHPFVATEIGDLLPHWEVAIYLTSHEAIERSARVFNLTLIALIALALAAILAGGTIVAFDARRQLAVARQKTDFVSNVSHELKTPLTSIRMFAELLQRDESLDANKRQRFLRIINLESERLSRLINNVLDFARIDKNRFKYQMVHIDLYSVLIEFWQTQSEHLREMGFEGDLTAEPGPYPVVCDPEAICRVLVNFLSNAEKYSADVKRIDMRVSRSSDELAIEIVDRGVGVPPAERERIFEPFHRVNDSLAGGVQGSGLGLALSRRIASDHGGSATCRANPEGGSIFTLTLPLKGRTQ